MHTHFLDLPEQGKKYILYIHVQCTCTYLHVHDSKVHTCTVVVQKRFDFDIVNHWKFTLYYFCSTFEIRIKTVKKTVETPVELPKQLSAG